ncbi:MAG: hypothetical protein M3458_01545 [Acidobacteriota bacterium]|nr:hypothetical protein [Acidobacteriota bacterium]
MSDIFHSSKYTLARAKHHIHDFERQVAEFFDTNPYRTVIETDPNTAEEVHKFKLIKPMPVALPGIASDAINNLRNALDHAAFACLKTGRHASFPFADSATKIENVIKGRCKDMPKEIADLMRAFEPYKGGNNLLWAMNQLCNSNKHAIVCPVATRSGGIFYRRVVLTEGGSLNTFPVWDRTKNEMEIFRVSPGGASEANFDIATCIAFRDVEFVDGQPANTLLNEFARIVESIIMAIEAEMRRLSVI